jgi:hypothetical protein
LFQCERFVGHQEIKSKLNTFKDKLLSEEKMKLKTMVTSMFALLLSFSAVLAQDDVIILNKDGEKIGIERSKEIRNGDAAVSADGATSVKVENGQVTVTGEDGTVRTFDLGEARSVSINRSTQTVDKDGQMTTKSVGRMILIGPDGARHEFELDGDGQAINTPGAVSAAPKEKSYMVGVNCQPVPDLLRAQLQLEGGVGLAVVRVAQDGPAEAAGIRVNDILMYADDLQLSTSKDLVTVVNQAGKEEGDLTLTLIRSGEEMNITVKPAERAALPTALGFPGMPAPRIFQDFRAAPGEFNFEFREMGPGVIVGPGLDAHPGFDAMNEKLKQMHERIEKLHKSMLDGGDIDQQ